MEHLPPAGWSHLATKSDIDNLRIELKADMQSLRSDLRADMHRLHASGLRWTVGLVFAGNAALLSVASFLN